MKKILIIMIALISLLVSGCSYEIKGKHYYTYQGENENWIGEYKVYDTLTFPKKDGKTYFESKETDLLTVTYKKDLSKLSDIRHVKISYEDGTKSGGSSSQYSDAPLNKKVFKLGGGSGSSSQLGDYLQQPENLAHSLLIFSGPRASINNYNKVIKVSISLEGKEEKIELKLNDKISWQDLIKDRNKIYFIK